MTIQPESITLIIAGKWNTYILSHDWVAKNIFKEDQINVEFSMDPDLPLRYHKDNIRFIPTNNNITFQALKDEEKVFNNIEEKAKNLIRELNKTPIKAFGINILYIEKDPLPEILKLFRLSDTITKKNTIKKTEIKRILEIDSKTVLNLTISLLEDNSFSVRFNYHTISLTSEEYLAFFKEKEKVIVEYIKHSKEIMKDVYKLEMKREENFDGE